MTVELLEYYVEGCVYGVDLGRCGYKEMINRFRKE